MDWALQLLYKLGNFLHYCYPILSQMCTGYLRFSLTPTDIIYFFNFLSFRQHIIPIYVPIHQHNTLASGRHSLPKMFSNKKSNLHNGLFDCSPYPFYCHPIELLCKHHIPIGALCTPSLHLRPSRILQVQGMIKHSVVSMKRAQVWANCCWKNCMDVQYFTRTRFLIDIHWLRLRNKILVKFDKRFCLFKNSHAFNLEGLRKIASNTT